MVWIEKCEVQAQGIERVYDTVYGHSRRFVVERPRGPQSRNTLTSALTFSGFKSLK